MDRILSLFPCCGPRRRASATSSNGQIHRSASEATPLLGAIHKSANSRQRPTQSTVGSRSGSSASESHADAPQKGQTNQPAYTPQDLAYITSWAKTSFLDIREPAVLVEPELLGSRGSSERLGGPSLAKRKSIAEELNAPEQQPAPEVEEAHQQRDAQVQTLVERLARAVAFDGWAMLPQDS